MEENNENYKKKQESEVEKNFKVFQKILDEIEPTNYGKFALMKNGEIKEFFNTWDDANKAGEVAYEDKIFSIQEVTREIVDLGYYSYAVV